MRQPGAGAHHEGVKAPPEAVDRGSQHEDEGHARQVAANGDDLGMLCHEPLLQKDDLKPTICEGG